MRRLWIYLFLVAALAVFAQQQLAPPDEPQAAEQPATGQGAEPGDAGGDAEGQAGAVSGAPGADGDAGEMAADESPVQVEEGDDQAEDEDAAEADMEFEPDEEISEDYPVPLPSDI